MSRRPRSTPSSYHPGGFNATLGLPSSPLTPLMRHPTNQTRTAPLTGIRQVWVPSTFMDPVYYVSHIVVFVEQQSWVKKPSMLQLTSYRLMLATHLPHTYLTPIPYKPIYCRRASQSQSGKYYILLSEHRALGFDNN